MATIVMFILSSLFVLFLFFFFFSSRRRHTRCALVTGVQTCALPICARNFGEGHGALRSRCVRRRASLLFEVPFGAASGSDRPAADPRSRARRRSGIERRDRKSVV